MPPNIVDIVIKAIGQLPAWLTSTADIVIKATPQFATWLTDHVDIVIKATPSFGAPWFLFCGFFLLMAWWFLDPIKE